MSKNGSLGTGTALAAILPFLLFKGCVLMAKAGKVGGAAIMVTAPSSADDAVRMMLREGDAAARVGIYRSADDLLGPPSSAYSIGRRPLHPHGGALNDDFFRTSDEVPFANLNAAEQESVGTLLPASFAHYAVVPRDAHEMRLVFGDALGNEALRHSVRSHHRLASMDRMTMAGARDGADDVLDFIRTSKSNYLTFTGHNDAGRLKLISGETVEISSLSKECALSGKKCIFLSCDSAEFAATDAAVGVRGSLTYDDALAAVNELEHAITADAMQVISLKSTSEILHSAINKGINRSQFRSQVRFVGTRVGGGKIIGGVTIGVSEQLSNEDSSKGSLQ